MRNSATRGLALLTSFSIVLAACDQASTSTDTAQTTTTGVAIAPVEVADSRGAALEITAEVADLPMADVAVPAPGDALDPVASAARMVSDPIRVELVQTKEGPFTIRFPVGDIRSGDASELFLAYFDEESGVWQPVDSQIDLANSVIIATVDHLSIWGLFEWEDELAAWADDQMREFGVFLLRGRTDLSPPDAATRTASAPRPAW